PDDRDRGRHPDAGLHAAGRPARRAGPPGRRRRPRAGPAAGCRRRRRQPLNPAGPARFATMAGPLHGRTPDMIVLEGLPALSPFRRERLQSRLQAVDPAVRITGAWYVYWLDAEGGEIQDRAALHRILQAGDAAAPAGAGTRTRYVSPRLGTLSPWASKAGELLRGAGLPVRRVERGVRVDVAGWPADPAAAAALERLLHDPMTQSLLPSHEAAAALFQAPARGAVQ